MNGIKTDKLFMIKTRVITVAIIVLFVIGIYIVETILDKYEKNKD
jgi:hypothetical protein